MNPIKHPCSSTIRTNSESPQRIVTLKPLGIDEALAAVQMEESVRGIVSQAARAQISTLILSFSTAVLAAIPGFSLFRPFDRPPMHSLSTGYGPRSDHGISVVDKNF